MVRYGFKIRTKTGQRVENVQILAPTLVDAERRLRQMYLQCEIMERREQLVPGRVEIAQLHAAQALARAAPMKSKSSAQ